MGEILLRLCPKAAPTLLIGDVPLVKGVAVVLLPSPMLDVCALVVIVGGGDLFTTLAIVVLWLVGVTH